jgi:hypothetical protein
VAAGVLALVVSSELDGGIVSYALFLSSEPIQEYLGHRSIEMTVRYTRISQRRFTGLWR